MGTYQKGYFRGISNIYLNLITCKDNIIIQPILKKLQIALVPYISPSSRNGYNGGNDFPTFVLARNQ